MANKCFESYAPIMSGTDYTLQQKQKNIYGTVLNNATLYATANPVKQNHKTYNNTISLIGGTFCLSAAQSYDVLNNYTAGQGLLEPSVIPIKYDSWAGALYAADYAAYGVDSVIYTSGSSWDTVVTDPSYSLFYDDCFSGFDAENRPEPWLGVVTSTSFSTTDFYKQATNTFVPACTPLN
jgi:hypothetical protein